MLEPQLGLRLTLADEAGRQRQLDVMAKIWPSTIVRYFQNQGVNVYVRDADAERQYSRARYFEKGDDLLVVKIPEFAFSPEEVDRIIGKLRAHKGVILDLRGNPGGYELTLSRLLGGIFQYDRKIFDRVGRNSTTPVSLTGRRHDAFTGRFAVLVDSESASASELFARVVQLEKRGFVVGDRTSGMVMEAQHFPHDGYGASVTVADLVMADGKTLEHVGVEPDIVILPTAQDLANGRDPAMAKAAGLVGVKLTPEEAGTILPYEQSKEETEIGRD